MRASRDAELRAMVLLKGRWNVDQAALMGALTRWCSPGFVASVNAGGIAHIEGSPADVAAMRTIYLRRRRRAGHDPRLMTQIEGVLRALDSVGSGEILML